MKDQVKSRIIGKEGFVFLDDEIDSYNAGWISREIYDMKSAGLEVTLKINSIGGSVLAGQSIIDAVVTTEANTHIIGIAASMAGIISQYGKNRIASSNAILMIHPPSGGPDDLRDKIRENLKQSLVSRSLITEEDVTAMLADGAGDRFFDAKEMSDMGLVDEVVNQGVNVDPTALLKERDVNALFNVFNKAIEKETNFKTVNMNVIKNTLKLADNASEERVNEAVKEVVNKLSAEELKNSELKTQVQNLTSENASLKQQVENVKKNEVKSLLDSYQEQGIVSPDNRAKFESLANTDMELAKEVLNSLKESTVVSSANFIEGSKEGSKEVTAEVFAKMNSEEKAKLAQEDPTLYNKLIMA